MKVHNRDFKGVWIPKEVYLNDSLSWTEKILLIEIDSLDMEQGCFASNEYLAEFLGITVTQVSRCIAKLKSKDLIYQQSFNGRKRILKSNVKADLTLMSKQPTQESQGSLSKKVKDNNTGSNTSKRFKKPELEELQNYMNDQGIHRFQTEGLKFMDYYDSVGWKVGRTLKPMKDWKAAVRNWIKNINQPKSSRYNVGQQEHGESL